ncbi:hypothetical protein WJX82_011624 [Trebouxia sp. C0006]
MQTDQSTPDSLKPPTGTNGESLGTNRESLGTQGDSQSAAGFVALDKAAAAVPAQSTASAANPATQAYADAVPHHRITGGGTDLVGRRIEIWWSKDKAFYPGVVKSYNHRKKTHLVAYTDGERFPEDLRHKKHKFPDMSNDVINPDAPSDSDSDEGASSQQEVLAANKPPASSASRVQHDKQPAVSDQTPKRTESGALMPRAATKALPSTPAPAAAARAVKATAQEADEAPVTKDKTPVTYSRKKKNPAASEAAAAAVTGSATHKSLPACGSSKRKSTATRPAPSQTQDPSAPKSVPSTAPRAAPGPAPTVTPRAAPSSVPALVPLGIRLKSAASPVPSSAPSPVAEEYALNPTKAAVLNHYSALMGGNEEKKRKGSASMHDAVLPPVLVQRSPRPAGHNVSLSQVSGPLGPGAVSCGPRTARHKPDFVNPRADVHEMMSRLVFQTNTHNVFRCSEPDGYELLAVLPGMSIDDISVSCQADGSMEICASPKPLEQMLWPIRPMHIHTRMPGPIIPSSASAQFTVDARLFVRVNSA